MSKTVGIYTLGCRVNQYESCVIAELLSKRGFEISKNEVCDYYVVNTCAVTAESERKSRQIVRRCASKGKVLVIGCASQLNPSFAEIDNVIYIGGNREKSKVVDVISANDFTDRMDVAPIDGAPYENMFFSGEYDLFSECRAFIKIQDGCNGKCTYCIIPKCRGSIRSRDAESIIKEAKALVQHGYREIILTGIEVGAYNKIPLFELVSRVAETEGLRRLRLGSLSPNVVNDEFLSVVAKYDCFMPHIHLSIQSCSDNVLSLMKRPYRKKDIFERVSAIRKFIPDCMISADIIVGFPGESEEDYQETVSALKELNIFHVHSFPYSEREGTPAASMANSIPKNVRTDRNTRLIASCKEIKVELMNKKIGNTLSVLVEKIIGDYAIGHTEEFFEAKFLCKDSSVGDIVDIDIISHDGEILIGIMR